MNDVRNLMDTLHTQVEYREFANALRAPEDSWSVLQRIKQATEKSAQPAAPAAAEPAPKARRSLLGRYAPAPGNAAVTTEAPAARRAPLAEIFALLERQAP
jgi:hypothetical protein